MYPYRLLPSPVGFPSPVGSPGAPPPGAPPPGGPLPGGRPPSRPGRRPSARLAIAAVAVMLLAACDPFAVLPATAATILLVSPDSIRAGFAVSLWATCGDNVNPAIVSSGAFGSATLMPSHGVLSRSVTIPPGTRPGSYPVHLSCASGRTRSAELTVLDRGVQPNPYMGPHTGGGEMAATTGARLALFGGLGAIVAGLGFWVMSLVRRRTAVIR